VFWVGNGIGTGPLYVNEDSKERPLSIQNYIIRLKPVNHLPYYLPKSAAYYKLNKFHSVPALMEQTSRFNKLNNFFFLEKPHGFDNIFALSPIESLTRMPVT